MEIHRIVAEHIGKYYKRLETRMLMVGTCGESEGDPGNTILQRIGEGKISRGRPARQWLDDVKQ